MSSYKKNIAVGITVLVALILLGYMILKFGDAPARLFSEDRMPVSFTADRAPGVNEGSPVYYRGVNVGRIAGVRLAPDSPQVIIDALLQTSSPLPKNLVGFIRTQGVIGASAAISLEVPAGQEPQGRLSAGDSLRAEYVGLEVLPAEFTALAQELTLLSRQLRESGIVANANQTILTLKDQIEKAGAVLESVHGMVGDPKIQSDIRAALSNVREATATAGRIGTQLEQTSKKLDAAVDSAQATLQKTNASLDQLSAQLNARLEQTSRILENFQSITAKIDRGEGTAGMLINDPKLYASLVDSTAELKALMTDLRRLAQQWEQEGATFRLK